MTPLFPKDIKCKIQFYIYRYKSDTYRLFSTFFAIFLFSAQKNCTFAPALRKKLLLYRKPATKDDSPWSKLMTGAAHQ